MISERPLKYGKKCGFSCATIYDIYDTNMGHLFIFVEIISNLYVDQAQSSICSLCVISIDSQNIKQLQLNR